MELIIANLAGPSRVQYATFNGRKYLVAPLTLIVSGVLAGSQGPLFYPGPEIAATANAWADMPLTIGHPTGPFGEPIPASDVPEKHIGMVRFPRYRDGKLTAEGWFDLDATRNADARVLDLLRNGQPIELSTGLYTHNEDRRGSYRGRPYTHIARNYQPDHLAILPDQRGACSLDDGCGVLNSRKDHGMYEEDLTAAEMDALFGPDVDVQPSIDHQPLAVPTYNWAQWQAEDRAKRDRTHNCGGTCNRQQHEEIPEEERDVLLPPTTNWQAEARRLKGRR